jgi:hypothetical protein
MTTTNDWIKMSERKPTEADLPLILGRNNSYGWTMQYCYETLVCLDDWTHWFPQSRPPAPPKEQTQRERDEAAYMTWFITTDLSAGYNTRWAWHAALAWERAEIAKMLAEYNINYPTEHWTAFAEKLRARLRP